jgi:hypothetical protein
LLPGRGPINRQSHRPCDDRTIFLDCVQQYPIPVMPEPAPHFVVGSLLRQSAVTSTIVKPSFRAASARRSSSVTN